MHFICKPAKVQIYINAARKTAAQIKAETGCTAIINGGLFNMSTFKATGNLKANGVEISREWGVSQGYAWSGDQLPVFGWSDMKAEDNFIGCVAMVENGNMLKMSYPSAMGGARPRTAFGTFADGRVWMYATSVNTTPETLQQVAFGAGVKDAIMLDGGGSTQGSSPAGVITSTRPIPYFVCVWKDNALDIIETDWKWASSMSERIATKRIILHHAAVSQSTALAIHNAHIQNGWSGIGYHYYVRKDGSIYRGRPENKQGIHAGGANSDSIGICFEGNYETDIMGEAQKAAGKALVADILDRYGNLEIIGHKDVNATACPGKNFPFEEISGAEIDTAPDPIPNTQEGNKVTITLNILRRGDKGGNVKALQMLLNGNGYNCGTPDGIFGTNTESAVKTFQKAKKLTSDGIVGANTWNAIMN